MYNVCRSLINKAGYTAISCGRVGRGGNARFLTFRLLSTDRPTDQPTDVSATKNVNFYTKSVYWRSLCVIESGTLSFPLRGLLDSWCLKSSASIRLINSSVLWIICLMNESNIRFAQICLYDRIACQIVSVEFACMKYAPFATSCQCLCCFYLLKLLTLNGAIVFRQSWLWKIVHGDGALTQLRSKVSTSAGSISLNVIYLLW